MARVSKLRHHVAICRRGKILKSFLIRMGESSLLTETIICLRVVKNNAFLEKVRKRKREKDGKKAPAIAIAFFLHSNKKSCFFF